MKHQSTHIPLVLSLLILLLAAIATAGHSEGQLRFGGYLLAPSDDDIWSKASGMDAQLIMWGKHAGIGFTFGYGEWTVPEQSSVISNSYYAVGSAVEGNANMTPLGLSLFLRTGSNSKVNLIIEGGLRLLLMGSDINASLVYYDYYNYATATGTIEIDNAFAGILAADLEIGGNETASLFVGGGLQIGGTSKMKFQNQELGEVELSAAFLRAGFTGRF
ncbi:MAG: hypothetical protein NTW97_05870 [Candidatus Krumholzibacteria bacterium]|nr:hypothetical protein [Candidatus Krumholzibacteria bacterium]